MIIRSRVGVFALALLLTSSAPALAAGADDFWVGVWQITIDGRDKESAFLAIEKVGKELRPRYFNSLWEEEPMSVARVEPKRLIMSGVPLSRHMQIELAPGEHGKMKGQWKLLHPQLPVSFPASAVKRSPLASGFRPLGFESQVDTNHVIDFNQLLLKKAPRDSFEKFKQFWISSVDTTFLPLVQDLVYPDGATPALTEERLRTIFNLLADPEFKAQSERVATEVKAVISTVKTKNPALYADNPIVLMPSLVEDPVSMDYIARKLVVRVDTQRISKKYQGDYLKAFLGRLQLKVRLWGVMPGADDRLDAVIVREGLATRFAVSLGLAKTPEQCFGLPEKALEHPAEKLAVRRKAILAYLRMGGKEVARTLLEAETPPTQEGLRIAYDFGDRLVGRFSVGEILAMPAARFALLLQEYLKE